MRDTNRHVARHVARGLTLACLTVLLVIAGYSWMPRIRVRANDTAASVRVAGVKPAHAPFRLRPAVEGDRSLNFGESRELPAQHVGAEDARRALESKRPRPRVQIRKQG